MVTSVIILLKTVYQLAIELTAVPCWMSYIKYGLTRSQQLPASDKQLTIRTEITVTEDGTKRTTRVLEPSQPIASRSTQVVETSNTVINSPFRNTLTRKIIDRPLMHYAF